MSTLTPEQRERVNNIINVPQVELDKYKTGTAETAYFVTYLYRMRLLSQVTSPIELHIIAKNYNWDDGFLLPIAIITNPLCELATATMLYQLTNNIFSAKKNVGVDSQQIEDQDSWETFKMLITAGVNTNLYSDKYSALLQAITK